MREPPESSRDAGVVNAEPPSKVKLPLLVASALKNWLKVPPPKSVTEAKFVEKLCPPPIEMYVGKEIKKGRGAAPSDQNKEPATLLEVTDLSTGEIAQIVTNEVLKSTLRDEYPQDTYVGKCFSITKKGREAGKQYNKFSIEEIEDPSTAETSTKAGKK